MNSEKQSASGHGRLLHIQIQGYVFVISAEWEAHRILRDRQEPAAYFLELWTRLELQMSPIYSNRMPEQLSPFAINPCTRVRHDQEGNSGFSRPTTPPSRYELDLSLMLRIPHFEILEPWSPIENPQFFEVPKSQAFAVATSIRAPRPDLVRICPACHCSVGLLALQSRAVSILGFGKPEAWLQGLGFNEGGRGEEHQAFRVSDSPVQYQTR